MTEFELDAKGERVMTRYAPGYFRMMADFIRAGRIGGTYGSFMITQPRDAGARLRRAQSAPPKLPGSQ